MRRIAILNQKGGVGKTTTTANLGAALALKGRRVVAVDLDSQGNLTDHLGLDVSEDMLTAYDVLTEGTSITDAARATSTKGLYVVPSHEDLAGVELELAGEIGRETRLRDAVNRLPEKSCDYLIIDCPPSLGILSLNAMAAVQEVYVALQTEYFALRGMTQLKRILDLVRERINPELRLAGIVATLVDPVTNLAKEVLDEVRKHFGDVVFQTRIRKSVRLAEAPGHRQHVFDYAPGSSGTHDYAALADEVEARAPAPPPKPAAKPAAAAAKTPVAGAKPPVAAPKPRVVVPPQAPAPAPVSAPARVSAPAAVPAPARAPAALPAPKKGASNGRTSPS